MLLLAVEISAIKARVLLRIDKKSLKMLNMKR